MRPLLDFVDPSEKQSLKQWLKDAPQNNEEVVFNLFNVQSCVTSIICDYEGQSAQELSIYPVDELIAQTPNSNNVVQLRNEPAGEPMVKEETIASYLSTEAGSKSSPNALPDEQINWHFEPVLPYNAVKGKWLNITSHTDLHELSMDDSEQYNEQLLDTAEKVFAKSRDIVGFVTLSALSLNLDSILGLFDERAKAASSILDQGIILLNYEHAHHNAHKALAWLSDTHALQIGYSLNQLDCPDFGNIHPDYIRLTQQWLESAICDEESRETAKQTVTALQDMGCIVWADRVDEQKTLAFVWSSKIDLISGRLVAEKKQSLIQNL
ncbi:MAG: EAL domain-containing protein [Gammaproteobacteria bacterium]|nr:EAL domain-containing protein [Gammaproteobacteria bacterium]